MEFRRVEDVRRALERRHGPIPDEIWELLLEGETPRMAVDNPDDFELAEDDLLRLMRAAQIGHGKRGHRQQAREPRTETIPADERLLALSEIMALEAARREDVQSFRRDVLAGRLLSVEEIPAWIKEQAAQDAKKGPRVPVKVAAAMPLDAVQQLIGSTPNDVAATLLNALTSGAATVVDVALAARAIAYREPGKSIVQNHPVTFGGVLWRLKTLVDALTRRYPWREEQAVEWVLAGSIPLISRAQVTLAGGRAGPRIILELDPRLSRTEVARLYGRWRSRVFRGADKPIERKTRHLAVFGEEHRESGKTWRELMAIWNQRHPEWPYHVPAHFAADVQRAWRQVTGEKWPPKKGGQRRGKAQGAR